uniref:Uncharacterized protein n=1 Tax=Chromera velia CCMP2878 TaxID=1169474 RepID=A0A0G4H2L7_9ALVE|eukprot:Cvel_24395.t1-p1 / transcript=Cvel_24395.t1 / gene=Cvel_24395 / organism=Chromera_velia_CCMP2878 / gene_product=hypothetical protein / transcript_product=hypothetical protein / location=Cvel_scaffold2631:7009-21087(-) / protein_length=1599 / sequence_SO=supercontig / SO=protein_coding / is_pseudo=false
MTDEIRMLFNVNVRQTMMGGWEEGVAGFSLALQFDVSLEITSADICISVLLQLDSMVALLMRQQAAVNSSSKAVHDFTMKFNKLRTQYLTELQFLRGQLSKVLDVAAERGVTMEDFENVTFFSTTWERDKGLPAEEDEDDEDDAGGDTFEQLRKARARVERLELHSETLMVESEERKRQLVEKQFQVRNLLGRIKDLEKKLHEQNNKPCEEFGIQTDFGPLPPDPDKLSIRPQVISFSIEAEFSQEALQKSQKNTTEAAQGGTRNPAVMNAQLEQLQRKLGSLKESLEKQQLKVAEEKERTEAVAREKEALQKEFDDFKEAQEAKEASLKTQRELESTTKSKGGNTKELREIKKKDERSEHSSSPSSSTAFKDAGDLGGKASSEENESRTDKASSVEKELSREKIEEEERAKMKEALKKEMDAERKKFEKEMKKEREAEEKRRKEREKEWEKQDKEREKANKAAAAAAIASQGKGPTGGSKTSSSEANSNSNSGSGSSKSNGGSGSARDSQTSSAVTKPPVELKQSGVQTDEPKEEDKTRQTIENQPASPAADTTQAHAPVEISPEKERPLQQSDGGPAREEELDEVASNFKSILDLFRTSFLDIMRAVSDGRDAPTEAKEAGAGGMFDKASASSGSSEGEGKSGEPSSKSENSGRSMDEKQQQQQRHSQSESVGGKGAGGLVEREPVSSSGSSSSFSSSSSSSSETLEAEEERASQHSNRDGDKSSNKEEKEEGDPSGSDKQAGSQVASGSGKESAVLSQSADQGSGGERKSAGKESEAKESGGKNSSSSASGDDPVHPEFRSGDEAGDGITLRSEGADGGGASVPTARKVPFESEEDDADASSEDLSLADLHRRHLRKALDFFGLSLESCQQCGAALESEHNGGAHEGHGTEGEIQQGVHGEGVGESPTRQQVSVPSPLTDVHRLNANSGLGQTGLVAGQHPGKRSFYAGKPVPIDTASEWGSPNMIAYPLGTEREHAPEGQRKDRRTRRQVTEGLEVTGNRITGGVGSMYPLGVSFVAFDKSVRSQPASARRSEGLEAEDALTEHGVDLDELEGSEIEFESGAPTADRLNLELILRSQTPRTATGAPLSVRVLGDDLAPSDGFSRLPEGPAEVALSGRAAIGKALTAAGALGERGPPVTPHRVSLHDPPSSPAAPSPFSRAMAEASSKMSLQTPQTAGGGSELMKSPSAVDRKRFSLLRENRLAQEHQQIAARLEAERVERERMLKDHMRRTLEVFKEISLGNVPKREPPSEVPVPRPLRLLEGRAIRGPSSSVVSEDAMTLRYEGQPSPETTAMTFRPEGGLPSSGCGGGGWPQYAHMMFLKRALQSEEGAVHCASLGTAMRGLSPLISRLHKAMDEELTKARERERELLTGALASATVEHGSPVLQSLEKCPRELLMARIIFLEQLLRHRLLKEKSGEIPTAAGGSSSPEAQPPISKQTGEKGEAKEGDANRKKGVSTQEIPHSRCDRHKPAQLTKLDLHANLLFAPPPATAGSSYCPPRMETKGSRRAGGGGETGARQSTDSAALPHTAGTTGGGKHPPTRSVRPFGGPVSVSPEKFRPSSCFAKKQRLQPLDVVDVQKRLSHSSSAGVRPHR